MNLDSAQRGVETFGAVLTDNIELWYPDTTGCATGCSSTKTVIGMPGSGTPEVDGLLVTHEIGHAVHKQQFSLNSAWPNPPADYSLNGAGWNNTTAEYDHAATIEGFGDFVAMTSWFEPNNGSTVPVGWSENYETATLENATCSSNKGIPIQTAKSFWDWDDWNNEDGVGQASGDDDEDAYGTTDIAKGWLYFADGTANRETKENDRDGVNMQDYLANTDTEWWGSDGTLIETLRDHNCLTSQDNN
jgi:hypothetical protein